MRFSRPRHKHAPKRCREIDSTNWIEVCEGCGRRRMARLGWGSESGTYYSRWFDIDELQKLKECFPKFKLFEESYKTVRENYDILVKDWDKHGGKWIVELSGQSITDLVDCNMSEYYRFDELSGEEQYAFCKWLERQKPQESG